MDGESSFDKYERIRRRLRADQDNLQKRARDRAFFLRMKKERKEGEFEEFLRNRERAAEERLKPRVNEFEEQQKLKGSSEQYF